MAIGRRRGRILAFQALYAWDISECPITELTDFSWINAPEGGFSEDDFHFPRLLFFGVCDHIAEIDTVIAENLDNWDFDRITRVDKALLRLSAYSLMFQSDIDPKIVINEAVSIAHDFGTPDSFKFVNAVLDSIKSKYKDSSA